MDADRLLAGMAAGAALQLALSARLRRPDSRLWLLPPLALLMGWLVGAASGDGYVSYVHYGAAYALVTAAFCVATNAPARIDEETVLALTAAFWLSFGGDILEHPLLLSLALPASAAVALLALTDFHPPLAARAGLYAWTLVVLVSLGWREWPSGAPGAAAVPPALLAVYLGSHAALLAHNIASLIVLLPLPLEDMSWKERWKLSKEHALKLAASYAPDQVPPLRAAAVVLGQLLFVSVASRTGWGEDGGAQQALLWLILTAKLLVSGPLRAPQAPRLPTTGELHRARRSRRREPGPQPG